MAETDRQDPTESLDPGSQGGGTATAAPPQREPAKPDAGGFVWGTGRRKSAIARVRIRKGEGKFLVNGKEVDNYFSEPQHRGACWAPLEATSNQGQFDVFVNAHGGGITGQAEAVLLGVARALANYDPALEPILRDQQYMTRDPRTVERKKYGQPGARRKFQFSKR
jgi:small subunit ribosomal protein S9